MSNKISVDPLSANPLSDAMYNMPMHNQYSFNNLQNIMQMKVLSTIQSNLGMFSTGNNIVDTVIVTLMQCILIGFITSFVTKLSSIPTYIYSSYNLAIYYVSQLWFFIIYKVLKRENVKKIKRNVDIPYISDTRQINELYKAIFWYLTHNEEIDYNKEQYLQFVYNHKLTIENLDLILADTNIHKILSQNKTKTIKYKDYEITYWLSTENITVHTDKDRVRENYKVQLSTIVPENLNIDILEEFCRHCLIEYVKSLTSNKWKQLIYTNSGTEWKSTPSNNTRKLDTIILKNGLKDEIKSDLDLFLKSEEWYTDRDIPYTRGYLLYGYPGTGKTSIIKGISTYSKRHIHYLILSNVRSDAELIELLKKINYNDTILVIEDIDATLDIVKSRDVENIDLEKKKEKEKETDKDEENKNKEKKEKTQLTLSGLLNAIDGVFSTHGRILAMTTNHPEVLDEALIRPGRIDCKFLFDNCDSSQIKDLFEMFFNQKPDEHLLNEIKNNKYSPAHITSVFLRYRNNPEEALKHLDDDCTKIFLPQREIYDKTILEDKKIDLPILTQPINNFDKMHIVPSFNMCEPYNKMCEMPMKMQGEISNFNILSDQAVNNSPKVI